jgi:hypothetical protein
MPARFDGKSRSRHRRWQWGHGARTTGRERTWLPRRGAAVLFLVSDDAKWVTGQTLDATQVGTGYRALATATRPSRPLRFIVDNARPAQHHRSRFRREPSSRPTEVQHGEDPVAGQRRLLRVVQL